MRTLLTKASPVLHLTRVTTAFAAVANAWFVILWTRGHAEEVASAALPAGAPLLQLLAGGAVNAVGLFAFAAVLNDVLDLRRDRVLNPDRPLAAGRLSMDMAVSLAVTTFMVSVLGAAMLSADAVIITVIVASFVMLLHAAGKHIPAVGLVMVALVYAGQMLTPNWTLAFVWPVWLAMTHAMIVAAITHRCSRTPPIITRRALAAAAAGWAFWSVVLLGQARLRSGQWWPEWAPVISAVGPAVLALIFAIITVRRLRRLGRTPRAAEKIARYGALWLSLYASAWLLGAGEIGSGMLLAALSAAGFLGMTLLREAYAMLEHPLGYRRL